MAWQFKVGERVRKTGGDYTFDGEIIARFTKKSGHGRYVVEDSRGICMIMNWTQLERSPVKTPRIKSHGN